MATPQMTTKDGFEFQLGINHLGHFLLTALLLPAMKGDAARPKRIVNVASSAHLFGRIDFDNLMRQRNYQPWDAYGQSKLANIMFTYELARKLKPADNITVNALHPGVVRTELGRCVWQQGGGGARRQLLCRHVLCAVLCMCGWRADDKCPAIPRQRRALSPALFFSPARVTCALLLPSSLPLAGTW